MNTIRDPDHVKQTVYTSLVHPHQVTLYNAPLIGCAIDPHSIACDQYTGKIPKAAEPNQ